MNGQLSGWRFLRAPLVFLVLALAGAISLLGVVSWFGMMHWTIELTSHFRFYYFLLGILLALAALALKQPGPAAVVGLVGVINGIAAWPHVSPPGALLVTNPPPAVRILWANLSNWRTDLPALQALVEGEKPDIAVFTELAASHAPVMRDLRAILPYQSRMPSGSALDLMLLSKAAPEFVHFDQSSGAAPLLVARICPPERTCLTVLGLHASRPFPYADGARDRQLAYAAGVARRHVDRGERVVFVGDFNATPFSPVFQQMLATSGLRDSIRVESEKPRAAISTWWWGNTGIGLPIDAALLGPGLLVADRRLGTPIGSDHLPLIVDIRVDP
jgi:endonuclease/exonuclease/phosphatase (EEP) superfamily protein YafD